MSVLILLDEHRNRERDRPLHPLVAGVRNVQVALAWPSNARPSAVKKWPGASPADVAFGAVEATTPLIQRGSVRGELLYPPRVTIRNCKVAGLIDHHSAKAVELAGVCARIGAPMTSSTEENFSTQLLNSSATYPFPARSVAMPQVAKPASPHLPYGERCPSDVSF